MGGFVKDDRVTDSADRVDEGEVSRFIEDAGGLGIIGLGNGKVVHEEDDASIGEEGI